MRAACRASPALHPPPPHAPSPPLAACVLPPLQAVEEVNWSRVYGGIHFRQAVTEGAKLGAAVAEAVIEQFDGE